MFSHAELWRAIDELAARNRMTASGLARRAGLDHTALSFSKRVYRDGSPRWPSTGTLSKLLAVVQMDLEAFGRLMTSLQSEAYSDYASTQVETIEPRQPDPD